VTTRVVIAEDEAIIRLDLKETLQEEGYEVVGETGRGDEAVALVRELAPDLAILDIKMPGLDGLAAAREISADRGAAVLILTAFSQRDLIEQARDAGALAYLVKPFQRSELIPAVEVAIGRFQHGNLALTLGPLNYLFSAPAPHRWHHARDPRIAACNFGGDVLVWDLLFGTFFLPSDREPSDDVGIPDGDAFPRSIGGVLASPFSWPRFRVPE